MLICDFECFDRFPTKRVTPEGPVPLPIIGGGPTASPEGPALPRYLQESDRSAIKPPHSKRKSKGGRRYSSDSSSSSTSSSGSDSSEDSSSESSGSSSSDSTSSFSGSSSSSSSESSDSSISSSSSSSFGGKMKKRKHHGQNGKFFKKRKGHKRHYKHCHHQKQKLMKKKAKMAMKQMKMNKTRAAREPKPEAIPEGPTLPPPPIAASQSVLSTSADLVVEWKERRAKSSTSSGNSSSSRTSSSDDDSSSSSTSSTDSEERERRERLKRKLFKSMPQAGGLLKEDSQHKRNEGFSQQVLNNFNAARGKAKNCLRGEAITFMADIGDDADSANRSKRRRTDQDPSSSNRAVEEGNVSDHEGEIEDHLRRRALDSLRRKKAGGGTGSESA
ncbi:hypothetical protein ACTXT7_010264 [Hymenolepis weldensis]